MPPPESVNDDADDDDLGDDNNGQVASTSRYASKVKLINFLDQVSRNWYEQGFTSMAKSSGSIILDLCQPCMKNVKEQLDSITTLYLLSIGGHFELFDLYDLDLLSLPKEHF